MPKHVLTIHKHFLTISRHWLTMLICFKQSPIFFKDTQTFFNEPHTFFVSGWSILMLKKYWMISVMVGVPVLDYFWTAMFQSSPTHRAHRRGSFLWVQSPSTLEALERCLRRTGTGIFPSRTCNKQQSNLTKYLIRSWTCFLVACILAIREQLVESSH